MGLSSKQVSSSTGVDWNHTLLEAQNLELPKPHPPMRKQQQITQQSECLKCPRCDSTNTKFCYYNNYNKSQPRHFCRACKRHWTKGGTLRNVPVGGGRKNKRVKKSTSSTTSTTSTTCTTTSIQTPLAIGDQKNMHSSSLYEALIIHPPSLQLQQNLMNTRGLESKDFGIGNRNSMFPSSILPLPPQSQSLIFPFSTSSSNFETIPCSVSSTSLQSSNVNYNYGEEFKLLEEPIINNNNSTRPWEIPAATSGGMEMSNYWSWEDIDSLVSSTDPNNPWDDSDIKP